MFISALNPSLNRDSVKFQKSWNAKDISLFKDSKPIIIVHKAGTNEVLFKDSKYRNIASYLGLTRYNTMIERLNNSKVHTYSPSLDQYVTRFALLQTGMEYKDTSLKGYTSNTIPIAGVDLFSLPEGLIALKSDKTTQYNKYLSANHAAYSIDGNFESKYIERYINIEKLVETKEGNFYFVKRPDYVAPKAKFRLSSVKGVKVYRIWRVVMYDPRYNTYVLFKSKAEVSEFIWGNRKFSGALERYLSRVENKSPFLFKKKRTFYFLFGLPKDITPINKEQYFSLIGNNRYVHK
jgi:hypothetical protein